MSLLISLMVWLVPAIGLVTLGYIMDIQGNDGIYYKLLGAYWMLGMIALAGIRMLIKRDKVE